MMSAALAATSASASSDGDPATGEQIHRIRESVMSYWDAYEYPEQEPKVLITFGPLKEGKAQFALIGPLTQPDGSGPKDVEYFEEVSGSWSSEDEARMVLNVRAESLIKNRGL